MSQLKNKHQAQLQSLYGLGEITFPDSLFWLAEFVLEWTPAEQEDFWWSLYNLEPAGPLAYLLQLAQGVSLDRLIADYGEYHSGNIAWDSWWVDCQCYDDLPEFLTCLQGAEQVSEHWGVLLDEPAAGFRGVAFCWNADASGFDVSASILAALVKRYEALEDNLDGNFMEDFVESIERWHPRLEAFIREHDINLDDGRPTGLESDTGLSIIPASDISIVDSEQAIALLQKGRSLWYWGTPNVADNRERLQQAHQLMREAYELMKRPKLVEILDVVYESKLYMLNNRN